MGTASAVPCNKHRLTSPAITAGVPQVRTQGQLSASPVADRSCISRPSPSPLFPTSTRKDTPGSSSERGGGNAPEGRSQPPGAADEGKNVFGESAVCDTRGVQGQSGRPRSTGSGRMEGRDSIGPSCSSQSSGSIDNEPPPSARLRPCRRAHSSKSNKAFRETVRVAKEWMEYRRGALESRTPTSKEMLHAVTT